MAHEKHKEKVKTTSGLVIFVGGLGAHEVTVALLPKTSAWHAVYTPLVFAVMSTTTVPRHFPSPTRSVHRFKFPWTKKISLFPAPICCNVASRQLRVSITM